MYRCTLQNEFRIFDDKVYRFFFSKMEKRCETARTKTTPKYMVTLRKKKRGKTQSLELYCYGGAAETLVATVAILKKKKKISNKHNILCVLKSKRVFVKVTTAVRMYTSHGIMHNTRIYNIMLTETSRN